MIRKASRINQRLELYTPKIDEFCFIIGAMKSGTTTLYHYLIQHPEISASQPQKEREFFSKEEQSDDLTSYFRQYLPWPGRRSIALDASTGYTKQPRFPNVAERLGRLTARKQLIYILRHPVDRIESHLGPGCLQAPGGGRGCPNTRDQLAPALQMRLSEEQRAQIADRLAPEMQRLRDEYDVDTSRWGFA